jgi:hypothetical protein
MQNIPQIFDAKGVFVEPADVSGLDAQTLDRLNGVRTAYRNLETAQAAERDAIQAINDRIEAVQDAKDYRAAHYPPSTPHDEWVMNFGSPEARRALVRRQTGK